MSLFTPVWGAATPRASGTVEVVLQPFPPTAPATDLVGMVTQISTGGGTAIPRDGAVLVARGSGASRLAAEAAIGENMLVRLVLRPNWAAVVDAIGGGPVIVRDGAPVFQALEDFSSSQVYPRNPRTGVGQLADGRLVFVVVDGRQRGYSVGMTNFELAQMLVRLGAVTGTALDSGGSSTMAFNGNLLNRPSDPGGARAVGDALTLFYYGVIAPQPTQPVLSPNGDGVAETQTLSFKVVRPSTVTRTLIGPDGLPHLTQTDARDPGTYRLAWSARTPTGTEPEGRWRWVVNALDDTGQHSRVERRFYLNNTLGYLKVKPARVVLRKRGGSVRVRFRLAHAAKVTLSIWTASGARVRTIRKNAARRADEHPLERALRQRRPRGLGPVHRSGADVERVRAGQARAPLLRAPGPALAPLQSRAVPLASFSSTLTSLIGDHGIYAVFILMVIDAVLPAASELVMLYAGVVASGALPGQDVVLFGHQIDSHFWAFVAMSMAGVLGNTVGSVIGWGIGYYGGRPLIEKRGRWLHLGPEKLDRAESWFARWGDWAVCLGRVTPVVRSFVSIPAGVARMPLGRFTVFTFLGCIPWCFGLAGIGWALGSSYESFHHDFRFVDIAVGVLVLAVVAIWLIRRRRASRLGRRASDPAR